MRNPVLPLLGALLLSAAPACAEGLLRIENCRIVDDRGPVKAMGVNYVDGFWNFARDGKREAYLPYLDALAEAKIPFIRMAFGPWANYKPEEPPPPQISDFVENRQRHFDRLAAFLADLKSRNIGAVVDIFWNIDPYLTYFGEATSAAAIPDSKTFSFLRTTVQEFGQRFGSESNIWMVEFINEGNMFIDFPKAPHIRGELVAQTRQLAENLRASGDQHLITSGNSMPRPAAEHISERLGWKHDTLQEFLFANAAETAPGVDVASVHVYPEPQKERDWAEGGALNVLAELTGQSRKTCMPLFVGEFGGPSRQDRELYIQTIEKSGVALSAIWGFGRIPPDIFKFGLDQEGLQLLSKVRKVGSK